MKKITIDLGDFAEILKGNTELIDKYKKQVYRICPICKTEFIVSQSRKEYCSIKCVQAYASREYRKREKTR